MTEQWLPVVGWEGLYEVSDHGRIKSLRYRRMMRPAPNPKGYIHITLHQGVKTTVDVHRLVAQAFIGPCPEGQEVNHRDNNKGNNRLDNLEYATKKANMYHAWHIMGVPAQRGEKNPMAQLTETDVEIMRQMWQAGESVADLAWRFCKSTGGVSDIVHRKSWRHI